MGDKKVFHFKKFSVCHNRSTMKVGTDGVLLGAWAQVEGAQKILDIGTGSGLIALMLAQRTPENVIIDCVEIAKGDFLQAKENFQASPWHTRLNVFHSDIRIFNSDHRYDLIISNPPFFSNSLLPPENNRVAARHTVHLTQKELIEACSRLLTPSGRIALILPQKEGEKFKEIALSGGFHCIREMSFKTRAEKPDERLLQEFSSLPGETEKTTLLLYSYGTEPSVEYRSLTRDFYLNF